MPWHEVFKSPQTFDVGSFWREETKTATTETIGDLAFDMPPLVIPLCIQAKRTSKADFKSLGGGPDYYDYQLPSF